MPDGVETNGHKVLEFVKSRWLSADTRWLGVFRWLLGALLSVDLLRRWAHARAFYTNDGLLPNHYSLFRPMGAHLFSVYHAFSTLPEVSVAFALTLLIYALFTLGWHTRLFHLLSAVCVTSLNARNLFVENGGTVVVNIITVLTLFLPLGTRFSLDALRRSLGLRHESNALELNDRENPPEPPARVFSLAVLALLVQWSAIYFFNTVHKSGEGWHNGTALHWFLQQDRIATGFAIWMRGVAPLGLIKVLTWGTLVVEGALSVLILLPFWQTWVRRLVLVLVWSLHGFIALSARIGPFSYVMALFPILLLGDRDWQLLSRWFARPVRARQVVYDGRSKLALALCRVLKRLDPFSRLQFFDYAAGPTPGGTSEARLTGVMLAVVEHDGRVARGEAALRSIARALPFGWPIALVTQLPGLGLLTRKFCESMTEHREQIASWFGLDRQPPVLETEPTRFRRELASFAGILREGAVAAVMLSILSQMAVENWFVNQRVHIRRPEWMALVIDYPRIYQGWSMFAPEPPYDDGRLVVDGRTVDGRKLDPFTGRSPTFDMFAPRGFGHDQFWCDYQNRIRFPNNAGNLDHLREYLLRQHEFSHRADDQLAAFDVWWVQERSPGPGETRGQPLPPVRLLSYGPVKDSGGGPFMANTLPAP